MSYWCSINESFRKKDEAPSIKHPISISRGLQMTRGLDCRGLACPTPVLKTRELVEEEHPDFIQVTVDNEAAKQNVLRFLESRNFEVNIETEGADFYLTGQRRAQDVVLETTAIEGKETEKKNIMVMVATDRMGYGDDKLGSGLM